MNALSIEAEPTRVLPLASLRDSASRILKAALAVHEALGPALSHDLYLRALALQLRQERLAYEREVVIDVRFQGDLVGRERVDLLFADCLALVIVEPAIGELALRRAQSLCAACGMGQALVLNFGGSRLEVRRVYRALNA